METKHIQNAKTTKENPRTAGKRDTHDFLEVSSADRHAWDTAGKAKGMMYASNVFLLLPMS